MALQQTATNSRLVANFSHGGTRPGLASQASTSQMPIMSFSLRESWSWSSPPCWWQVGRLLYSSERRNIRLRQGYGGQARATHIQSWFPRHSLATAGPGQPRSFFAAHRKAPANRVSGATVSGSANRVKPSAAGRNWDFHWQRATLVGCWRWT